MLLEGVEYAPSLVFSSARLLASCKEEVKSYSTEYESVVRGRFLGALYQKEILQGLPCAAHIQYIDLKIGYGLFASRSFAKGEFVGEYVGLVRRYWPLRMYPNPFIGELRISDGVPLRFIVDAHRIANETRFINHSSKKPNLKSMTVICHDLLHPIFIADRDIEMGEQLTYDYGPSYWRRREALDL